MGTDLMAKQAAELTAEEWEDRKHAAQDIHKKVLQGVQAGRASAWALAGALYEFSQETAWAALGYDSLNQYLADPAVNISRRTYFRYVSCWLEFVERRKLDIDSLMDIDITKADIVLGAVQQGRVSVNKGLADARALGAGDLREAYGPAKPAKAPEPAHENGKRTDGTEGQQDEAPVTADQVDQVDAPKVATSDNGSSGHLPETPASTPPVEESGESSAEEVVEVEAEEVTATVEAPLTYEDVLAEFTQAYASGAENPRIARNAIGWVLDFLEDAPVEARSAEREQHCRQQLAMIYEVWRPLSHKRIPTVLNEAIEAAVAP